MSAELTLLPAPQPSPWRWWVCGLLFLATTLNYMDRVAMNQTADQIKAAFGLNNEEYGLIESTFVAAFGLGTLVCGWLVDRISVRWVYPVLVLGWSVAGFLTGYASTVAFLFACRFGLGLFEAGNWPCGVRTTRQVLPPEERSLGNAMFQGGTAVGALAATQIILLCFRITGPDDPDAWRLPLRIIGVIGTLWVLLWVLTLPRGLIGSPAAATLKPGERTPFYLVFREARFWLLVLIVIAVNTAWHTGRLWVPLFLREHLGYSKTATQVFGAWYYTLAEVGSLSVGFLTLRFTRFGFPLHRCRVIAFGACTAIVLSTALLPFLGSEESTAAVLLALGFGSYGLFPTYLALSQELSSEHQGKITGCLGFLNSVYLAGMYWLEGRVIDVTQRHDWVLAVAGVPAAAALASVVMLWPWPTPEGVPTDLGTRDESASGFQVGGNQGAGSDRARGTPGSDSHPVAAAPGSLGLPISVAAPKPDVPLDPSAG
jgi:ACS family hexuronate transporter-like MFS transporter